MKGRRKLGNPFQRGTMAGWLTGWHFSFRCAGFGLESLVVFAWLIISLEPNFQLETSQSRQLQKHSSPWDAQSGGSNYSQVGSSGVLLFGGFQEQDVHTSAAIVWPWLLESKGKPGAWEEGSIMLSFPMGQALLWALGGAPERASVPHSQPPTPILQLTPVLLLTSKLNLYWNPSSRLVLYQGWWCPYIAGTPQLSSLYNTLNKAE